MSSPSQLGLPWYRQAWPWFLLAIPASSVVFGFLMLYLALHSNNSLVVDDYYKEGKAINQRIARDARAAALGVHASILSRPQGLRLRLRFEPPPKASARMPDADDDRRMPAPMPSAIGLRWVHVTQSRLDGKVLLHAAGHDRFSSDTATLPAQGRYRVHIEPVDGDWRLVSTPLDFGHATGQQRAFDIPPPSLQRFTPNR